MAGQATVAADLIMQLPDKLDAIIIPVGGGGLIGGIAAMVKAWTPDAQVCVVDETGDCSAMCNAQKMAEAVS